MVTLYSLGGARFESRPWGSSSHEEKDVIVGHGRSHSYPLQFIRRYIAQVLAVVRLIRMVRGPKKQVNVHIPGIEAL